MAAALVTCTRCNTALAPGALNQPDFAPCPGCGTPLQVEVFPALFQPIPPGSVGEAVMIEGEASCFYHPLKKAVVPCDACGRFLCALCDCELNGQHVCPACVETGRRKGKLKSLENQRTLYDSIALALAVLPLLIFYFTVVTAPIALFMVFRYWNAPRSLVHRSRARFLAAAILAGLQIIGWIVAVYFIVREVRSHG